MFSESKCKYISGPINKIEGPLPKLRYRVEILQGEYSTREDALKHCKNPKTKRHVQQLVYSCYDNKIVSVCLDNYRMVSKGNGVKPASEALFCDDGVVTISSAKLNGVKDFPFLKDWYAMHGYIHSPTIQPAFPADESITESTDIFEKVDELLNEDIPRMPLKNSSAKIIRVRGDVQYRYFSTQNWVSLKTPFMPDHAKKLKNNWCRIKTDEGSAELGFFLNRHQRGPFT